VHLTVQARFGAGASKKGLQGYLVGVLCYKNLVEAVELTLARCWAEIRKGAALAFSEEEREAGEPLRIPTEFVSVEHWKPVLDGCFERERLSRQAQRLDHNDQVVALRAQGSAEHRDCTACWSE